MTAVQIELHPYLQQRHIVRFCEKIGMTVTAYSPFGTRPAVNVAAVVEPRRPNRWQIVCSTRNDTREGGACSGESFSEETCRKVQAQCRTGQCTTLSRNALLVQVVLRWMLQRSPRVVVIPKTAHAERAKENFHVWDFELTEDDMKEIANLDCGRYGPPQQRLWHGM